MPAYAYPIEISREKKVLRTIKYVHLDDDVLSIELLTPIVGDNIFTVEENEDGSCNLCILHARLETDAELAHRVAKEERYMKEYYKRHPEKVKR